MKKLLLLGGTRNTIPVIHAAHKLGIYVITCDYLPNNIGHHYSDEYRNVSIIDREAVLALADSLKIDGIMSFAIDPGVVTAAYVASKLNLPSCPYDSVKILQNKVSFRNFLKENGFNVPQIMGFRNKDDAVSKVEKFDFPIIIKPADASGSKGVTKINHITQLEKAFDYAFQNSLSGEVIIEEFIEQKYHSSDTDCFSVENELVCASFSCQYFDTNSVNPYVPSAYSWPSNMPSDKIDELRAELQRLIKLLNLGTSIYNIETRVGKNDKAYIMEVTPRGGGNRLAEMVRYSSGQDMILNSVKAAVGLPVDNMSDPVYSGAWAEYIIHSNREGIFDALSIAPDFEEKYVVEKDIWVTSGDFIHTFSSASYAIGTLVLKFENQMELKQKMKDIDKYVRIIFK